MKHGQGSFAVLLGKCLILAFAVVLFSGNDNSCTIQFGPDPIEGEGEGEGVVEGEGEGEVAGDIIFSADFDLDIVGEAPDTTLPGDPVGDRLTLGERSGSSRVRESVGDLMNQPVEMSQINGVGSMDLVGTVAGAPPTSGLWSVSWKSLLQPGGIFFIPVVVRDDTGLIVASMSYRPGLLSFGSGTASIGVSYTTGVAQDFAFLIDLDLKTVNLYVDGVLYVEDANFYQSSASNIARFGFEFGGQTAQTLAADDMLIMRLE
jgi:hypothetical protein